MSENGFWDVRIGWKPARVGVDWAEVSAHIAGEYAATAMEAIARCAEWRDAPPEAEWRAVTVKWCERPKDYKPHV